MVQLKDYKFLKVGKSFTMFQFQMVQLKGKLLELFHLTPIVFQFQMVQLKGFY